MVAYDAVTIGWRVVWLVAAVAMRMRSDTAPAAPLSVHASLMLNRSEMKAVPSPMASPSTHLVDQVTGRLRGTGQRVEAELFEDGHARESSAARRSATRSSAASMPTDSRTRSAGTSSGEPAAEAWVIDAGCSISDSTPPSDSASVNSRVRSQTAERAASPPAAGS